MTTRATGSFELKQWDEHPYIEEKDVARLTQASVTNAYRGDIEGEGTLHYLMTYRHDGEGWNSADFVGYEYVNGRLGDRSGSFVLQHTGVFEEGAAKGNLSVVPGSGAGDLRGIRGSGSFVARHNVQPTPFTLDYDFEQ